ncbi:immediate early response 3-interacting protein 1 [Nematocida major]|uniref:immediate early response 3-interacting protein 1 n=1 Tax=Nematocida major TaxID=1912982 RepID=UPI0020073942|nr:immediate early response 3-interacting protein 1 [Nematocida major]KAH9385616.1 immediate early response 3-interacting protein 1 [Nematocida major]
MFGLGTILYTFTMLGNSVCILNEDRFLNNVGICRKSDHASIRQLSELIRTVKTLCFIPLIIVNSLFICYWMLLG